MFGFVGLSEDNKVRTRCAPSLPLFLSSCPAPRLPPRLISPSCSLSTGAHLQGHRGRKGKHAAPVFMTTALRSPHPTIPRSPRSLPAASLSPRLASLAADRRPLRLDPYHPRCRVEGKQPQAPHHEVRSTRPSPLPRALADPLLPPDAGSSRPSPRSTRDHCPVPLLSAAQCTAYPSSLSRATENALSLDP